MVKNYILVSFCSTIPIYNSDDILFSYKTYATFTYFRFFSGTSGFCFSA